MIHETGEPSAPESDRSYLLWNLDAHELDATEARILQVLGAALVSEWPGVASHTQEAIFNRAANQPVAEADDLRTKLARFLHDHAKKVR